jgi:hypothetical protein
MQTKGGNGGRGERVQHSSVGSMLACCPGRPEFESWLGTTGRFFLLRESNKERGEESKL